MITCKTCGVNNAPGTPDCRVCGAVIAQPAQTSTQDQTVPGSAQVAAASVNGVSKKLQGGLLRAMTLASWGAGGGLVGQLIFELAPFHLMPLLNDAFAFAAAGGAIAAAITIGQAIYIKRRWIESGTFLSGGFGLVAGAISGAIANVAYNFVGPNNFTRILAWGLVGLLLGLGLSVRISNLDRLKSVGAGLIGGLLGGSLEVIDSQIGSGLLSLLSCSAIGFLIALMIVVGDTLFREAWLEIQYGPRESRTISLGRDPVCIGSSASACAIYVRGVAPIARKYELVDRRVVITDVDSGRKTRPALDEAETIGNVTVIVRGSK